ncbi:copper-translocating p-type atpase [Stagonosporopsis vannaccii]|nr:copper-translocating p-type atpase [Stagonosporopsis vannaccii]
MACCILTAVIMNQLIKICDALDVSFLQIKYNDDEEGGSCAPAERQQKPKTGTCRITIDGMTCSACSSSITRDLEGLRGVYRASVSLAIGRATVSYDTSVITVEHLLNSIKEMGYSAAVGKQNALETIERLHHSTELGGLKQALSSASVCSTLIVGLEYVPVSIISSTLPSSVCRLFAYMALVLAARVQIIDARSIHSRAWDHIGRRKLTMDTLLSLSLLLGIGLALLRTFLQQYRQSVAYASSGSFLTIVILAGKYLETVLRRESNRNLAALYELQADRDMYELADSKIAVSASLLRKGDHVLIYPHTTIPCDCYILEGNSAINESTITGETLPVMKNEGDLILAGTKNLSSRIRVVVALDQTESSLAKVIEGVAAASEQHLEGTEFLDVVMRYFVSGVVGLAAAAFLVTIWRHRSTSSLQNFVTACERAATILAAACPCGIGLATPSAAMAGIDIARTQGVLLGGGIRTMRALSSTTHVIMDKTGTLTQGLLGVSSHYFAEDLRLNRQLCYRLLAAAEFEEARIHPVAGAVFKWALSNAQGRPSDLVPETRNLQRVLGMGVSCEVKGHSDEWIAVHVGHASFLSSNNVSIPRTQGCNEPAASRVHFAFSSRYAGSLVISDSVRPNACSVVTKLLESGRKVTMLTGDNKEEAARISNALGIQVLASRALPHDKVAHVKELQARGHHVAMVGDGVNDAPAQAAADVGISVSCTQGFLVGSGSVVIVSGDLHALVALFAISKSVVWQAKMNVCWALVYNIMALSLALGLWEPWGLSITQSMAGTLMAGSSASVLGMSLWLRWRLRNSVLLGN